MEIISAIALLQLKTMEKFNKTKYINGLIVTGAIILVSVLISYLFPVYFRNDDGTGLFWASTHNLMDAFSLSEATIGGTYRPINYIFWWITYNIFGHNALYYQITVTVIFLAVLSQFYQISKVYIGSKAAILPILIHIALFSGLYYVTFWFSDTTFTIQLLFTFLSIRYYLNRERFWGNIYASYLFAALAYLTKEPSMIIIVAFVSSDILVKSNWKILTRQSIIALPYICMAIAILAVSPTLQSRPLNNGSIEILLQMVAFRADFYHSSLLSGIRVLIPALLATILILNLNNSNYTKLGLLLILSIPAFFSPAYYFIITIAYAIGLVKKYNSLLGPLIWITFTSLPLLILKFYTPTYLLEFSFGLSLFIAYAIYSTYQKLDYRITLNSIVQNRKNLLLAITIAITGITFISIEISNQYKALTNVVEQRQNFAAAIQYINNHKNSIEQIIVMDAKPQSEAQKGVQKLMSNAGKAIQQKTMSRLGLSDLLKSMKINHIECIKYSQLKHKHKLERKSVLLLQNSKDIKAATQQNLITDTLFVHSHYGNQQLLICTLNGQPNCQGRIQE